MHFTNENQSMPNMPEPPKNPPVKIYPLPHKAEPSHSKNPTMAVYPLSEKGEPLHQPHLSQEKMYTELLKNPDVQKQASVEGKKVSDLARELTEKFPKERYGGTVEHDEIKKQLEYQDPLEYNRIMNQESTSREKFQKLKEKREEKSLLKKIFGIK